MSSFANTLAAIRPALYIAGEWRAASDGTERPVIDPAIEETLYTLPVATQSDLAAAAQAADAAFRTWKHESPVVRGNLLREASRLLRSHDRFVAPLITRENGKTLAEATAEVHWACDYLEWYAEEGRRAYGRVIPAKTPGTRQMVVREPVGPVLGLCPWNWPLVTACRKVGPALAAGCTIVLKPAEETPSGPLALVHALIACGLPKGVVNVVMGDPARISDTLLAAPEIRKVSFTGSVNVGRELAATAARNLKLMTMELGGHAPVLVFADADIDGAIAKLIPTKFRTCGQVCSSPTRFIVHEDIADAFIARFADAAKALKVGPGMAEGTVVGPLVSGRRLAAMERLVADAVERGATIVTGGQRVGETGYFFAPTILRNVAPGSLILDEEPFGPVVPFQTFSTYEEAVGLANHRSLALSAYAFTGSLATAQRLSEDVRCGMLGVNSLAVSMAEAPFGGVMDSGYGKEGGIEGLDAYLQSKFLVEAIA